MDQIELLFLGTGTSAGVPMIGCHCETCSSSDPHDVRTRPSVIISYAGKRVLVDTTPELRVQCIRERIDSIDAIVFTHGHADHIMGLDDVRRFNVVTGRALDVWADESCHAALTRCFGYAFTPPVPEQKLFRPNLVKRVIEGAFEIERVRWTPVPLLHGKMPILGFRVGRVAYCTDVSEIPESSFELLKDLDVLVLDALQIKPHSTHFSLSQAVEAAGRIGAKETYFTHIAHALKHEPTNISLPANMRLSYDGFRVKGARSEILPMRISQFHPSRDRKMWQDYISLGLTAQAIGAVTLYGGIYNRTDNILTMGNVVIVLATAVLMCGLGRMAEKSGRSKWWGLMGLLSFAGYMVVLVIVGLDDAGKRKPPQAFEVVCNRDYRRDVWRMDVTVKIDPAIALTGDESIVLQLPRGASVKTALKTLAGVLPELGLAPAKLCCAINGNRATMKDEMSHGDVLWLGIEGGAAAG